MSSEPVNYTWTRDSTKLLIGLRSEYDADFDDPTQRKIDVWERISMVLKESGYDFPPSICDKKWRNLLGSFRRSCSRSQGRNPRYPYTWEFYNDLVDFWQKKDPEGLKALNINVEQQENGNEYEDGGDEQNGGFDDMYNSSHDQSDEDGVGDMARYLSVNLNEAGDDDVDDAVSDGEGSSSALPYVPGLIIEETEMTGEQSGDDDDGLVTEDVGETMANEDELNDDDDNEQGNEFQMCNEVSLEPTTTSRGGGLNHQLNRPGGGGGAGSRPYLPASVTIEELSTGMTRPLRFKRKLSENSPANTNGFGNCRNGDQLNNYSLREPKPIVSIHELPTNNDLSNHAKRFREDTSSPPNSNNNVWLKLMKEQEANAQRRWEITESRQAREAELQREVDKQIQQSLNKLTSVIAMLVQRTAK